MRGRHDIRFLLAILFAIGLADAAAAQRSCKQGIPCGKSCRHEPDGDTHGWLKVDPQFKSMLNAGNTSDEHGNLVFELVCHYTVTQTDAKPSCKSFKDHTVIPPIGTHVQVKGTFVQDKMHAKWNEIHPVEHCREAIIGADRSTRAISSATTRAIIRPLGRHLP